MNWKKQYQKALTFSYDDGNVQDKKLLDILNRYGMKCTFNVNTGLDFDHGTWVYRDVLEVHRLNLAECPELYAGHEMAVHGVYHYNLTELSPAELTAELQENAETITKLYGTAPVGMAYPYGVYNDTVIAELNRLGIRYARGVESSHSFAEQADLMRFQPTCHHDDPQLFDLAKQFLESEPETPQIFYIWGHSYEFEGQQKWDRLERFCEMLAGRGDIFYGTNREVLLPDEEPKTK